MLLEVRGVVSYYGLSLALHGISLDVDKGEVVALLGRNGAGKTTTLKSIMGLLRPRSGSIKFKGREVRGKAPFQIARMGIGYVPEDRRIFADLTAEENLELSRRVSAQGAKGWSLEDVYRLFPLLKGLRARKGRFLSGGEQKMLAIGRALIKGPDLLLLDEPAEGLSPLLVSAFTGFIKRVQEAGVAVLVADQNLRFCRKVAQRGYIIDRGLIRYQGDMDDIWHNEEVVRQYLAV